MLYVVLYGTYLGKTQTGFETTPRVPYHIKIRNNKIFYKLRANMYQVLQNICRIKIDQFQFIKLSTKDEHYLFQIQTALENILF